MTAPTSPLSPAEVREFVSDYPSENLLLDKEEFSDTFISLCMDLAVESFNAMTPSSAYTTATFPSKSILLMGTLWKMYAGRCAVLARNHMNYTDGGLQIPIEERISLYQGLATQYGGEFADAASKLKVHLNMESGWGQVYSDGGLLPWW